ncbi:WD repeat protein [Sphaerulina musiva SO2202]|uniref:Serine-threonine kinase receptor-associated protein n=1 Tax=Sphaerulina musiva (strain SO2202) TaxID=692275 RepID=M3B0D3_SPHMS|nr:WD repeat protein [Sphaerulina musiva SO2202]EMF13252.1 WD repeat protein [Sphaerulina musiva SO2202]
MDFAFKRQDDAGITTEITKVVPLTCHGHSRPITHVSFSSQLSGSGATSQFYMISACKDNNPMLRDGLTGDWIGTFIGHKGAVWSARLSDDATLAATGSADFSAKVWDTFTGETLHTLQHNHIVRAVAFPPQDRPQVLATGGMEKKLRIFDLSGTSSNARTPGEETNGATNGITNPDPPSYEIGAGEHQGAIKSIIWSRDINVIITAADDKKVRWWNLSTRSCIASYEIEGLPGSCELNSGVGLGYPNGIISVAAGKNIYFFDGGRPGHLIKHIATEREVASVALNGESKRFVTGCPNDTWVHVWDFESGRELETGRGHHGPVWTTCFSPDGRLYATGSEDGTVKLWKFTEGAYGLWR